MVARAGPGRQPPGRDLSGGRAAKAAKTAIWPAKAPILPL